MTSNEQEELNLPQYFIDIINELNNIASNQLVPGDSLLDKMLRFCLDLGLRIIPNRTRLLLELPVYKSYRLAILKALSNREQQGKYQQNDEDYLYNCFVEFFCIYSEIMKEGNELEFLSSIYKDLLNKIALTTGTHKIEIYGFLGILNNKYEESKALDSIRKAEHTAEKATQKAAGAILTKASETMTKVWSGQADDYTISVMILTTVAFCLAIACIYWPPLWYTSEATRPLYEATKFLLIYGIKDEWTSFSIGKFFSLALPHFSFFAIVQTMLIYFFRVTRRELEKAIEQRNLLRHRAAASELMEGYVEYLIAHGISAVNATEKIDELMFGKIQNTSSEEITPYDTYSKSDKEKSDNK